MKDVIWTVPADLPAFAGHFPGRPIVPGVVLVDRALLAIGQALGRPLAGTRLGAAKFFSPVGPGETLVFSFSALAGGDIRFTIRAGDREVASGNLTLPTSPAP